MIVTSILVLGGIALFFGTVLGIVGEKLKVPVDPRLEEILRRLPGSNCGACGYAGCMGMAEALFNGRTEKLNCSLCGQEDAEAIFRIIGVQGEITERMTARIYCQGQDSKIKYIYRGVRECRAQHLLAQGARQCSYACLMLGDCARICPYGAIEWQEGAIPRINSALCVACGKCVTECPRGIIRIDPASRREHIKCSSKDKGAAVRAYCSVGCIGCGACVRACPVEAITLKDNLAVIDYSKCIDCDACREKCPAKTIIRYSEKETANNAESKKNGQSAGRTGDMRIV